MQVVIIGKWGRTNITFNVKSGASEEYRTGEFFHLVLDTRHMDPVSKRIMGEYAGDYKIVGIEHLGVLNEDESIDIGHRAKLYLKRVRHCYDDDDD